MARRFETEPVQRRWLGRILSLELPETGPDLADDTIAIELKCRYRRYAHRFAVHEYQIREFPPMHEGKELYWAFLLYDLAWNGKSAIGDVQRRIRDREAWCLPWRWIDNFPPSLTKTGPYRYVGVEDIPTTLATYGCRGGILHVPKSSCLERRLRQR